RGKLARVRGIAQPRTEAGQPKRRPEPGLAMPKAKAKSKSTGSRKWGRTVKTDSTHPPEGLFTKSAAMIARTLASKKVSPKGPASGLRMLTYFINRGGKGLTDERRAILERAKKMLSARIKKAKSAAGLSN